MNLDWRSPLAVALGAVPGALSRYYLGLLAARLWGTAWPWGTGLINLSGAIAMGCLATWATARGGFSPELRLLLGTGFLGAYTTFSTYALETANLARSGWTGGAIAYNLGSALLGWLGLELGSLIARRWPG